MKPVTTDSNESANDSAIKRGEPLLFEMRGIGKQFAGVSVLRDVSFELRAGELHTLAGENGAGKSTLMKILAGVHTEYDGTIRLNSQAVRFATVHDARDAGVSVIHQELSLIGSMSVAENIFLGRELSRCGWLNRREMIQQTEKLLAEMGLDVDASQSVERYPIGVQQMIEICKALSLDCKIIVMDEPTSALTKPEAEKLFAMIDRLKQQGCGIVYISHKMEEIYRLSDRITVLRDGEYIGTESAEKLPYNLLVNWMVGRDLSDQAVRREVVPGKELLRVEKFVVPGAKSGRDHRLVKEVSFSIRAGEIVGIAGLQGSGNSELLNGIFGAYNNTVQGAVTIDGRLLKRFSPTNAMKNGLALLTNNRKETGLVLGQSIVRNASLAALKTFSSCGWLKPSVERKTVEENCQQLQLKAASLDQNVETLSGGNQQKVVLAKWIATEPKVLLLDEPTRGVDIGAKHEIYELLNRWTSAGMAIVMITSEMPELLAMSDRILVMRLGEIVAEFGRDEATQEKILTAALSDTISG